MKVLRNNEGRPVVRVPNSNYYNIVGTDGYELAPEVHSEIRKFDINLEATVFLISGRYSSHIAGINANGENSYDTQRLVKEAEDGVSCVNYYGRNMKGELVLYYGNKAINIMNGNEVKKSKKRYSPIEIKRGYVIPSIRDDWHVVKRVKHDGSIVLEDGFCWDEEYLVSNLIEYMQTKLQLKILEDKR